MIAKTSFCFLCCMVLVVVRSGLHYPIHVYCLVCAMRMLALGCLSLMCLLCSQCRISIDLPVWPTYELLIYIWRWSLFCWVVFYRVLLVRNTIFSLILFNKFVTLCVSGLLFMKVTHFFFIVFVWLWLFYCFLLLYLLHWISGLYLRPHKSTSDTNYIVKSYRLHFINNNHLNILVW